MVQGTLSAAAPLVVWNLRERLGPFFPLQIFYTHEAEHAMMAWFGDDPHIKLKRLPVPYFTSLGSHMSNRNSLTSVFTDDAFWEEVEKGFGGTHVLTIQTE